MNIFNISQSKYFQTNIQDMSNINLKCFPCSTFPLTLILKAKV